MKQYFTVLILITILILIGSLNTGCSRSSSCTAFDILIKGGAIYDGTLSEPYVADIGIKGDKITAIGNLTGKAKKTIDARGLIVTPGFIDVHTHCDLPFKNAGFKRYFAYLDPAWKGNYNYIYQGVTTVVTGNCGWGFPDTNKWLGFLRRLRFGTNVCTLIPHGDLRNELFGEADPKELTPQQLELMKKRVAQQMQKGAIGIATGLEYAPGCVSTTDELIELAKVVKKYGGFYVSHIRDNTGTIYKDGEPGVLKAIKEAIEIGRRAGVPVHISHIQVNAPWDDVRASQLLELIEKARKEGLDITADAYPYNAGFSWLTMLTPPKYKTSTGIRDEYKTEEGRAELKKAVEETFTYLSPEKVIINIYPEKKSYEGKTLKEIADIEGKSPADCYVDIVCSTKAPMCMFFDQKLDIVEAIMPHEYIFTASDGWTIPKGSSIPHPRCFGTFPRKIRVYVLDKKLISLKDAIRSMTSLPAQKFKMESRGKIAVGYFADIVVIDLKTIQDKATYQNPGQYSEGIVYLLVNGVPSIENGKATGKRGGKVLKGSVPLH